MRISKVAFGLALVLIVACSRSRTNSPADGGIYDRPELTVVACEAQGGEVVGDIGDGAIFEPEYRCPGSGEEPIGRIVADPEGSVPVEGAVCCR